MSRVLGIAGRIVVFLIPILIFYGVMRVTWLGYPLGGYQLVDSNPSLSGYDEIIFNYGGFLPSVDEFISIFTNIPKIQEYLEPALKNWNEAERAWADARVTDFVSFWETAGKFFQLVGSIFWIIGMAISYPFAVIGWIFSGLFQPCQGEYCTGTVTPIILEEVSSSSFSI